MRRLALITLALAGCSEHGVTPPDVPIPPPPPPQHGIVSVHVSQDGTSLAGVRVIFTDLLDGLVGDTTTDAGGFASLDVQTVGTITVVDPFGAPAGGTHDVRSFRSIAIGQTIEVSRAAAPTTAKVTFTAPLDGNAATYKVQTTCGGAPLTKGASQAKATVTLSCAITDVLLVTADASGTALHSIFQTDVAISDGATVALTGYNAVGSTPLTLSVPVGDSTIAVAATLQTVHGSLGTQTIQVPLSSGFGSTTLPTPVIAAALVLDIALPPDAGELASQHALVTGQPGIDQSIFIDRMALLPHLISAPSFSAPNNIFWSEISDTFIARGAPEEAPVDAQPPPMLTADFAIAKLSITRGTATWFWSVAVPHSGGFASLPTLPIDLQDLVPTTTDTVSIDKLLEGRDEGYFSLVPRIDAIDTSADLIPEVAGVPAFFQELDRNAGLAARAR